MRRVLVVGSGFAGFWAVMAAKRVGGASLDVVMAARESVLQVRPRLYEADPAQLKIDLGPLLTGAGVSFFEGQANNLDLGDRSVEFATGRRIRYDRLVVATGSIMQRPDAPGSDHAHSIDTLADAVAFDAALARVAREVRAPTVAIVGAGFTGIELALEMRDRLAAHGGVGVGERARILLIDRTTRVGAELGPGPGPAIEAALRDARVETVLGAHIVAFELDGVTLQGGRSIQAHAIVLATGLRAAGFVANVPGDFDALGRVAVDAELRAPRARDVFVTGDAASADTGNGHMSLQSCQHALQLGRVAGENAARDLLGMPLLAYSQPSYVTCLDLGRAGAVLTTGWSREVVATGEQAKAVKRDINTRRIYPPPGVDPAALLDASKVG